MKTTRNILIAFLLNLFFSIFELIGGFMTGSIAIMSDSIHDLGDAISIGISYFLERKSHQKPDNKHTYGYIRYSVIGSVITTTILIVGSIFVIIESLKRIINPVTINYNGMIVLAIIGLIINLIASYVTKEGDSLNQKAVNLHMLEDVLGWIVVLIGSILMKFTNIALIDSILSMVVALFILYHAINNMKKVVEIFLETTPNNIDIEKIKTSLKKMNDIIDVHHMHIKSIDGYNNEATMHVIVEKYDGNIKNKVREELKKHNICHSTIELELKEENCQNQECHINHKSHHH